MDNGSSRTLLASLLFACLFLCGLLAPHPINRTTWFVENITMWIIVATITILHICGIHFPNTTYLLMAVLIYLHTIVEHYTFALIPFDSVTEFFGFARNNFYRAAHFSVEFYAYAIAEMLGAVTATAFSFWMHGTWRIKSELSCAYHLG